jgi:hypothetical protein
MNTKRNEPGRSTLRFLGQPAALPLLLMCAYLRFKLHDQSLDLGGVGDAKPPHFGPGMADELTPKGESIGVDRMAAQALRAVDSGGEVLGEGSV